MTTALISRDREPLHGQFIWSALTRLIHRQYLANEGMSLTARGGTIGLPISGANASPAANAVISIVNYSHAVGMGPKQIAILPSSWAGEVCMP
jgi:hypothetical protein